MRTLGAVFLSIFATCAVSEENPELKYQVEFTEDGRATLVAVGEVEQEGEDNSEFWNLSERFAKEDFRSYAITGPDGQEGILSIPGSLPPGRWTNADNTYGITLLPAGFGGSSQLPPNANVLARAALKNLAEAAYSEFCGSTVRPSEFSIEVEVGAELVVSGKAKVSAKFVSAEICK